MRPMQSDSPRSCGSRRASPPPLPSARIRRPRRSSPPEGRPAVRRQVRCAPAERGRPRPGARRSWPSGTDLSDPRRGRGHRPGRRDPLAGLHRCAHPPDGRVDRRLEAGVSSTASAARLAEQAIESTVHARKVLEAGFTTVRDVGSERPARRRPAERDRQRAGPRPADAGRGPQRWAPGAAMPTRPGCATTCCKELGPAEGIAHGPDGFREAVRYQVKYGADVIKFCASGGVLSLADEVDTPQLTLEEMTALVDEAHRLRKKVAATATATGPPGTRSSPGSTRSSTARS